MSDTFLLEDFKQAMFDHLAQFQYVDTGGNYGVVTYNSSSDRWVFPSGYSFDYLQNEGADGFAAMLTVMLQHGRTTFNLPKVTIGGKDYGRVQYFPDSLSEDMMLTKIRMGDDMLLEQMLYARPFGFEKIHVNPAGYSMDHSSYSDVYLQKKISLFINSVYDSEWYHWGEFFGYDANFIDVDADVDVGNSFQDKVFFGGNKKNDIVSGSWLGGDQKLKGSGDANATVSFYPIQFWHRYYFAKQ